MKLKLSDGGWNPYMAGALVGFLALGSVIATTVLLDRTRFIGASTTFVRAAGFVERSVAPEYVKNNEYFSGRGVKVDWQFMLVIGIFLGALLSSITDRSFKLETVPPLWRERFGESIFLRAVAAFGGGILAMIGARLAGGCPSGHGLSGLMQLSVSGFVALFAFFGVGIVVAKNLYRRERS